MVKILGNREGSILLERRILFQRRILSAVVTLLFALLLFCLSVVAVFGQNSATAAVGFLRFAPDAAHQGMGRTGTGERFNTNAAFWNIAAAAPEYSTNATVSDATNSPQHFAVSAQLPPVGVRDAMLIYGTLQGIRLGTGSLVVSGTYLRIFQNSVTEYAVSAGYAQPINEELSIGTQLRFV